MTVKLDRHSPPSLSTHTTSTAAVAAPIRTEPRPEGPSSPRITLGTYLPGMEVTARVRKPQVRLDGGSTPAPKGGAQPQFEQVPATVLGHDVHGKPVIQTVADATKLHVDWKDVKPRSPEQPIRESSTQGDLGILLAGLPEAAFSRPPGKIIDAVHQALERQVVAGRRVRDFRTGLLDARHLVSLVGGSVRDSLRDLAQNPDTPVSELTKRFGDTDLVTTALPSQVRAVNNALIPNPAERQIWTPSAVDRFGVVGIGDRKFGLDIATVRVGVAGRDGAIFGKHLKADAEARDFSVNELYYLVDEELLIDPTGQGVEDAQQHILRVNEKDFLANDMLSMRYLKFRARGFKGDPRTRELMREHLLATWPPMQEKGGRFVTNFLRIIPGDCTTRAALEAYIEKIRGVMVEDGMADLFPTFIAPIAEALVTELESRHK